MDGSASNVSLSGMRQKTYAITKEVVLIVFAKLKLFICVFCLIFIPAFIFAVVSPSYYRASGKFTLAVPEQLDPLRKENFYDYQSRAERLLQDQKEVILSDRVLKKAIKVVYPDIDEKKVPRLIDELRKNIEVNPPKGANFKEASVFYVSFVDTDPKKAATMANAICNGYLEAYNEITKEKAVFSYMFFKEQVDRLQIELSEAEKKLRDYESEHGQELLGLLNLDPERGTNMEVGANALLTQFSAKYYELQEKLAGLTVTIEALENELKTSTNPAVPEEMQVVGHAITTFKLRLSQLEIQMNELRAQFTEQFPVLKQTEKEMKLNVASLREELSRNLRAKKITAEGISAQIAELEKIIESLKQRIQETAGKRAAYEQLRRQYQLARETYMKARDKLEEARIAASLNQAQQMVTYVDTPSVPTRPFKPNRPVIATLGFLAGLLFALALVVTVDFLDHTIKKPEDLEARLGVNFLGSIPRSF
jgi:uncharacterized protein involved in exopolysaccharide biosynthesis